MIVYNVAKRNLIQRHQNTDIKKQKTKCTEIQQNQFAPIIFTKHLYLKPVPLCRFTTDVANIYTISKEILKCIRTTFELLVVQYLCPLIGP